MKHANPENSDADRTQEPQNQSEVIGSSLREALGRCPYKYRDKNCGYTGNLPTCDKTIAHCRAHFGSGALPFGGFPFTETTTRTTNLPIEGCDCYDCEQAIRQLTP